MVRFVCTISSNEYAQTNRHSPTIRYIPFLQESYNGNLQTDGFCLPPCPETPDSVASSFLFIGTQFCKVWLVSVGSFKRFRFGDCQKSDQFSTIGGMRVFVIEFVHAEME